MTPLSVSAIAGEPAFRNLFDVSDEHDVGHIRLARETDLVVVAPATADLLARMAHGIADDLATAVLLATDRPVMAAPAMNPKMWEAPATLRNVTLSSMVAMMAGADFVKTSTGKESVNATLPVGLAMVRAIRAYHEQTGYLIGFKPAGGISTAKASLDWLVLIREELGRPWLEPELFRFGASSLLTDIERQLEHHVSGRYSAAHRHAMA